ncbi:hypothetical protein A4X13_0g9173 [Tilletia indica]|uniref:Uncharacterized protein n=1 Tax=Tilletia indica TaxID=43049 RepID=A0A177TLW2_9BASI|nr:hypothetical protein A4X13_0g9173 [Tilletia indica]
MAKQKKADTAGPVEVKKKKKDKRQRGEWTGEQELALVKLLIENPSYQETLFHIWLPRKMRHLRQDLASKDVVEGSEHIILPMEVDSVLKAIVVQIFGRDGLKSQSDVNSHLRRMRYLYLNHRGMMDPDAQRMLLRDMTSDAEDAKMTQMSQKRRALLTKLPWWDAYHELVLTCERRSKESSIQAPTSKPSETPDAVRSKKGSKDPPNSKPYQTSSTGQYPIKREKQDREEWPQIYTTSVHQVDSDVKEGPSAFRSQLTEPAFSHQQITQVTISASHSDESQADIKPPKRKHASNKTRSSRQPTASIATVGRYRHERNMMRTQLLIEREAIKRLRLEREATKRLELELKEKESERLLKVFSERMDALEDRMMKRLGSLEKNVTGV